MRVLATGQFLKAARRSGRMTGRLAALVDQTPPQDSPCADRVGEDIVGWARRDRQLELYFVVPERAVPSDVAVPPLAAVSLGELRRAGLDDSLVASVRGVRRIDELKALGLPERVRRTLEFMWIQNATGQPDEPLSRCAESLEELDRFLRGELRRLLLNLDDSQRHIVALPASGPILVRGVAGSGKTAVAMHRICELLKQRSLLDAPKVLYLTFNRSLAYAAGEMLEQLEVPTRELQVETLHRWCANYVGRARNILPAERRRALIQEAREAARGALRDSALWSWPTTFFEDEIHLIKGRLLPGAREEYLRLPRHGAGRPLDQRLRELAWAVYEEYLGRCAREGVVDWDDIVCRAHLRMVEQGDDAPRFGHVFVDEAQDLTPMAMRIVAALARPSGNLVVAYDPAQSIYERGFRWKDCGITVHGSRSFELKRNYRSTAQILEAARPLLTGMERARRSEDTESVIQPDLAARQGPPPRVLVTAPRGELPGIVADIRTLIERDRIPPANIAVLCYPNALRDEMYEELRRASVNAQKHDSESTIRLQDRSVKVLPVKSAKGLEFPVVYLLASGRFYRAPAALRHDEVEAAAWRDEMRRVFYMAMTRAMTSLVLVHGAGDPAPFLSDLKLDGPTAPGR